MNNIPMPGSNPDHRLLYTTINGVIKWFAIHGGISSNRLLAFMV